MPRLKKTIPSLVRARRLIAAAETPDHSLTLPAECPVTLEHAKVHLNSAIEHEGSDPDQAAHDASIAGRILLTLTHRFHAQHPEAGGDTTA